MYDMTNISSIYQLIPPKQNGHHFTDDNFKCIFVNEKFCNFIKILLKFVAKGPNWQYHSIALDSGLAQNRQQALTEPMLTLSTDAYMRY